MQGSSTGSAAPGTRPRWVFLSLVSNFMLWDQAWLVLVLVLLFATAAMGARWYFQASRTDALLCALCFGAFCTRLARRKGRCAEARGMESWSAVLSKERKSDVPAAVF